MRQETYLLVVLVLFLLSVSNGVEVDMIYADVRAGAGVLGDGAEER